MKTKILYLLIMLSPVSCQKELFRQETVSPIAGPVEINFTTCLRESPFTKVQRPGSRGEVGRLTCVTSARQTGLVYRELLPFEEAGENAATKASAVEVTSVPVFNLVCTTGSAGSESYAWALSQTGTNTGKFWPASHPSYHFYASNSALTFNTAGCTAAAANNTDVVVAYIPSPAYNTGNVLQFHHIFGRIGNVTVNPGEGFTSGDITQVSVTVTPRTGGTYNLRTGAWSSVTVGPSTVIASATPGTQANGLYLVPGNYTVSASWKAKEKNYSGSGTVEIVAGRQLNITLALGGELVFTFGGLEIAPCNAMWNGSKFVIPYDDWNHCDPDLYGKTAGSYYFSYVQAGSYFDSRGSMFSYKTDEIKNNGLRVSYGDHDDWRMMSMAETYTLSVGTSPGNSREGSVVNHVAGVKFALVELPDLTYPSWQVASGLLLFPDNRTISGRPLSYVNDVTNYNTDITGSELDAYLSQGCAFLPNGGVRTGAGFSGPNKGGGYYMTCTTTINESVTTYDDSRRQRWHWVSSPGSPAYPDVFGNSMRWVSYRSGYEQYDNIRLVRDASP